MPIVELRGPVRRLDERDALSKQRGQAQRITDCGYQSGGKRIAEPVDDRKAPIERRHPWSLVRVSVRGNGSDHRNIAQRVPSAQYSPRVQTEREPDARREIVPVGSVDSAIRAPYSGVQKSAGQIETWDLQRTGRAKRKPAGRAVVTLGARAFVLPSQADVERQTTADLPIVLKIQAVIPVLDRDTCIRREGS